MPDEPIEPEEEIIEDDESEWWEEEPVERAGLPAVVDEEYVSPLKAASLAEREEKEKERLKAGPVSEAEIVRVKEKAKRDRAGKRAWARLTEKQRMFVKGVVSGKTHKQAYIDAGGKSRHPTYKAYVMMKSPLVLAAINELRRLSGMEMGALAERLRSLVYGGGARLDQLEDWLTGRKTLKKLAAEGVDLSWIENISVTPVAKGRTARALQMPNKLAAMRLMADILGKIEAAEPPQSAESGVASRITVRSIQELNVLVEQAMAMPFIPSLATRTKTLPGPEDDPTTQDGG